jgi:hypothetical protein
MYLARHVESKLTCRESRDFINWIIQYVLSVLEGRKKLIVY